MDREKTKWRSSDTVSCSLGSVGLAISVPKGRAISAGLPIWNFCLPMDENALALDRTVQACGQQIAAFESLSQLVDQLGDNLAVLEVLPLQ